VSEIRPITEADLQAYADARLSEPRKSQVEAWLAERPEEAERIAAYRRLSEDLRATYDPLLAEAVPERMRLSVWGGRGRAFGLAAGANCVFASLDLLCAGVAPWPAGWTSTFSAHPS